MIGESARAYMRLRAVDARIRCICDRSYKRTLVPQMSDDAQATPSTLPEPTDARLSMRAVLIVMAVVAGVAALAGPIVRRLDSTSQVRLLLVWSIWLAAAMLWIGYLVYRRARVEKLAGRTLLRLPMFDERVATGSPTRALGQRDRVAVHVRDRADRCQRDGS